MKLSKGVVEKDAHSHSAEWLDAVKKTKKGTKTPYNRIYGNQLTLLSRFVNI